MFKRKVPQFLVALLTAIGLTGVLSTPSPAYVAPTSSGAGTTTASNTNIIYYPVDPAQAGLTQFTTRWMKGELVNGVCRHIIDLPKQPGNTLWSVQQIAYNPTTCSDLVREGTGPGLHQIHHHSLATVQPQGASSSNGGCHGHFELSTRWQDPLGITLSRVVTCAREISGQCQAGDHREWYTLSGWTEVKHSLKQVTRGTWCYGETYEHMHNTPFCGGTDIYYDPSAFGSDTEGNEDGNPNTWVSGCASQLLHYTWQFDPAGDPEP